MAELLLKVGATASYKDGDILCAFSRRRIAYEHCHLQCWKRNPVTRRLASLDVDGLIPTTDVLYDYCENFQEYRLEQLSKKEGLITRLSDAAEIRFNSNQTFTDFSGKAVQMDIELYVARRLASLKRANAQGKPLFKGTNGAIWHGGKSATTNVAKLNTVWNSLVTKNGLVKTAPRFRHFPLGKQDLLSHLAIAVNDFNDTTAEMLVEPDLDLTDPENPIVVQKRKRYIDWKAHLADMGVTEAGIRNKRTKIDIRKTMTKRLYSTLMKTRVKAIV